MYTLQTSHKCGIRTQKCASTNAHNSSGISTLETYLMFKSFLCYKSTGQ